MALLDWLKKDRRRQRRERDGRRKEQARLRKRFHKVGDRIKALNAGIRKRDQQIAAQQGTPGEKALRAAATMLGKSETGYNDAPWLRSMEKDVLKAGASLDWMIPGQPYCGLGVIWSYLEGAGLKLPDGTVYTPNILGYAGQTFKAEDGRTYRLVRVAPEQATKGAIVVMDFAPGTGADHVGLARGPMRGGVIPTRDFNTSPGNSGSQANGGGVYDRNRPRFCVLGVLNVVLVK